MLINTGVQIMLHYTCIHKVCIGKLTYELTNNAPILSRYIKMCIITKFTCYMKLTKNQTL